MEITKEIALKNKKPVSKVRIKSHVTGTLKRANLVLTNIKQGQDLNITKINNHIHMQQHGPSLTW